jgi:uncharacterized membrane protein
MSFSTYFINWDKILDECKIINILRELIQELLRTLWQNNYFRTTQNPNQIPFPTMCVWLLTFRSQTGTWMLDFPIRYYFYFAIYIKKTFLQFQTVYNGYVI